MAKRPPERYRPGELDNTRNNIGWVTEEEARRISQLLGGDVGVERPPESVEDKYQQLQDLNRRKSDRIISGDSVSDGGERRSLSRSDQPFLITRERPRFRDRIRMNFLAARPEHAIKTLPNAIASILTRSDEARDYIHPKIIIDGDALFFHHIENMVIAVRGLLALNRRHPENRLKIRFYRQILEVVKSWDIEGLHAELTRLQISPRHLTFRYCGTLARKLFSPIYRLIDIDAIYYLRSALKRLYDLNIMSLPKNHADIDRIKEYYHHSVYEVEHIFGPLKYRLFPLLMKLCSLKFYKSDRFYYEERYEILAFLSVDESEIVTIPSAESQESDAPATLEESDEPAEPVLDAAKNQKGLEVLERLFPKAGWERLNEFPDLYPYLHPILSFPRGFELVRPDDPIQQTVTLAFLLQELFYGFRHIQFGVLYQSVGLKLGETIQQIIEGWRIVCDEFISRSYLPQLYDYCREVEHSPEFVGTEYGTKRQRGLQWQVKEYLLPHLVVHRGAAPDVSQSMRSLHELTTELLELLSAVSIDLTGHEKDEIRCVRNPWEKYVFDIESPVTRRLQAVLHRYREEANNANLLLYTFSVLTLLDSLINSDSSFYYPLPVEPPYRTEHPGTSAPYYEVQTIDTDALFREAARDAPLPETPPESRKVSTDDELTGTLNERGLRRHVDREVSRLRSDNIPFSIVSIEPKEFDEYCRENGEEAGVTLLGDLTDVIRGQIREHRDIPGRLESALFSILLPETARDEATYLALRLYAASLKAEIFPHGISIGIFQMQKTWSADRAFRMMRRSVLAAGEFDGPSIGLYDDKANQFFQFQNSG